MTELLSLTGIRKEFPGVLALDGVDFDLRPGEVHALLGENGAGKSTLIKVMTGVYRPDAGGMQLAGKPYAPQSAGGAVATGVSTVYQEVNLLPNLTVSQNLLLGREPRRFGLIDRARMNSLAQEALTAFGIRLDVRRPLGLLSVAEQQMVAIARAVAQSADVLILDEPTASLDSDEVDLLFSIVRRLRDKGLGIIFVTHFLDQVYALSDRITVLRNGRKVGTFGASALPRPKLIEHMLGRELKAEAGKHQAAAGQRSGESLLAVDKISVARSIREISVDIHAGEAVGLTGLLGSGRTETCRALFGLDALDSGEVRIRGARVNLASPGRAIEVGIALCPEDRKTSGIVAELSVRENIILALQARRGFWRPLSRKEQDELARNAIGDLKIATPDAEKPVGQLSGGNQQKVILARWMATDPDILILDEPTRGIDVGAHAEILRLIRQLCATGMGLLVASSELEEVVAFSDRVVVLRDKAKVAELSGDQISEDNIMRAIAS